MYKRILFPCFFICFGFFVIASCDSDYNELGADMIGEDSFEVGEPETFTVKAYNQVLDPVETSDLSINSLGIYNDPIFGETTASLAVQVQLATLNPTFDEVLQPQIDSVVLTVPYNFTRLKTETDGSSTYDLDSIYGPNTGGKIKLRVHESNYFIQNLDPNSTTGETKKYFNDQRIDFENAKGTWLNDFVDTRANHPAYAQNDEFFFDNKEIVDHTLNSSGVVQKTRYAPRMRMYLNKDFFKTKIFQAPSGKLLNNSIFKEYFRGLYFSVEHSGSSLGNLAMLNIKAGSIVIYYTQLEEEPSSTNPAPGREKKTFVLNLNGRSVNFIERQPMSAPADPNMLYLKGHQGSMAIVDLFGRDDHGNSQELTDLRAKKWLVNDASLTFRVNRNLMSSAAYEPNRIYLYDLTNKRPIVDYYSDQSSSSVTKYAKSVFGGIIKKQDNRGYEYKIRLTNYIRALLKNEDSTNVRLGLVVTENIGEINNKKLKTEIPTFGIKQIPTSSVMNPLGTIIYGTDASINEDDRIKFKIYFTKPKQN